MIRQGWTAGCVFCLSATLSACGGSDSSSGGGAGTGGSGGVAGASASGGMGGASGSGSGGLGGTSASGGSGASGGSSGTAGMAGASGAGGAAGIPIDLGTPCKNDACSPGLTPVSYCGFAGCSAGSSCSCEIPCDKDPKVCPTGTTCTTVSDGPGTVCVK